MSDRRFVKLSDISDVKVGLQTGDNEYYLRKCEGARGNYQMLDESLLLTDYEIAILSDDEKENGIDPHRYGGKHFLPYDKGGASDAQGGWLPNYYVPTQYFINWSKSAVNRLKNDPRARFQNSQFYFKEGLTFSSRGEYSPTFRIKCPGPFDKESSCIFSNSDTVNLIGILASKTIKYLFRSFIQDTVSSDVDSLKEIVLLTDCDSSNYVNQIISNQRVNLQYDYINRTYPKTSITWLI